MCSLAPSIYFCSHIKFRDSKEAAEGVTYILGQTPTFPIMLCPPPSRLGTKLMRLVKDRGRMEQLAVGGAQPVSRVRDVEMEEMMEELQEKVRGLQGENEGLKQRLLVAKQQIINSQSRRPPTPYGRVPSRVNTGLKKLRDDASSPSQTRPKSTSQIFICAVSAEYM